MNDWLDRVESQVSEIRMLVCAVVARFEQVQAFDAACLLGTTEYDVEMPTAIGQVCSFGLPMSSRDFVVLDTHGEN